MTVKNCRACDEAISDPNAPCPRCGFKKDPLFSQKLWKFSLLFAIMGTLWLLFLTKDMWSE